MCAPCHEEVLDDPGVIVIRDCTTSGCHSWDDVGPLDGEGTPPNGWHHDTDLSGPENCVACHDPNVIDEIAPFADLTKDLPGSFSVTPLACGNCHWEQAHSATGDPDDPGHPSTYDHYDASGKFVGFKEYSGPIYGNFDTHHMGFKGDVTSHCSKCHGQDPNEMFWDPYDPKLIRYCEICHSAASLHAIPGHIFQTYGWEAVGFHVDGGIDPTDLDPTIYRTWEKTGPYLPETQPGFSGNELCLGCHSNSISEPLPAPSYSPVIDTTSSGIQPNHALCGSRVVLRGEWFGGVYTAGYRVQMKSSFSGDLWMDMPVYSWTDTLIEFEVPCWIVEPGNYKVRVMTPTGMSNQVVFTLEGLSSITGISPQAGPCGEWVTLSGVGFGNTRKEVFSDGYYGIHRIVEFVTPQGRTVTALSYGDWTDWSIELWLNSLFEDADPRNFIQDDGTNGYPEEPTQDKCDGLPLGSYSVYVSAIFFGDEDGSGDLSRGDTIFEPLQESNRVSLELMAPPPVARFSGGPTRGAVPLAVTVKDASTGIIDTWEWDFDNDMVVDSTEQNPSYTYYTPGTYTVSLTVSGPGGSSTDTKVDSVTVQDDSTKKKTLTTQVGCFIAAAAMGS
jgi:PKD repeat protein